MYKAFLGVECVLTGRDSFVSSELIENMNEKLVQGRLKAGDILSIRFDNSLTEWQWYKIVSSAQTVGAPCKEFFSVNKNTKEVTGPNKYGTTKFNDDSVTVYEATSFCCYKNVYSLVKV